MTTENKAIDEIKTVSFIRFKEGNEYRFMMDHGMYQYAPSDVDFYPVKEINGWLMEFVGDGYGVMPEHNLTGRYGNGSIALLTKDIPHLINWCRDNFISQSKTTRP